MKTPFNVLIFNAKALTLSLFLVGLVSATAAAKPPPVLQNPAVVFMGYKDFKGDWQYLGLMNSLGTVKRELLLLPRGQLVLDCAWSPDAKKIAFLRANRTTSAPYIDQKCLCLINSDGSGYQVVKQFSDSDQITRLAWMPDGRRLILTAGNYPEFYTFDLDAQALALQVLPVEFVYDQNFSISVSSDLEPTLDGYQGVIAMSAIPAMGDYWLLEPDLWLLPMQDGPEGKLVFGSPVQLTATPGIAEVAPHISPDGKKVAYCYAPEAGDVTNPLRVISVESGESQNLGTPEVGGAPRVAWSPDGQWIALDLIIPGGGKSWGEVSIWRLRPDGSGLFHMTPADTFFPDWNPKWVNDIGQR